MTTNFNTIIKKTLQKGVSEGIFSGAQASWSCKNDTINTVTTGYTSDNLKNIIHDNTLFDVASLTKVFTLGAVLRLYERNLLTLDTPIKSIISADYPQNDWNFSILDILTHETGLIDWLPFYKKIPKEHRESKEGKKLILKQIFDQKLAAITGTTLYSDLGFIALAEILETITHIELKDLITNEIIKPLKLQQTSFKPLQNTDTKDIAATSICPWTNKQLHGKVNDDNARTMGGVSGHAGIFANSRDITILGQHFLNNCSKHTNTQNPWISKETIKLVSAKRKSGRTIGFDTKSDSNSSVGDIASAKTYGHLGFTGTSLWIDPKNEIVVTLLTNRVHKTMDNKKIKLFRPYFHNIFFKNILSG